ncbi:MAG: metal-dependent transcriptional regulator [Bacteroidota bacterium]
MVAPSIALVVGTVLIAVLLALFLPKRGLVARWQQFQRNTSRVLAEDALKHVYDCEYKNVHSSLQSIAGALAISPDKAIRLVSRLEGMGLVSSRANALTLTADGRSYALRIIRVHRLLEHYLADETGLHETEWHKEAERQEHRLAPGEVDALAARMGNPGFDPHGDPIPTANGDLPTPIGIPLTDLEGGGIGTIVHIEDEPPTVYAQLVAQGLYPGMQIRMVESIRDRIRFAANEEERILAPLLARNITIRRIPVEEKLEGPHKTLASVKAGEAAVVVGISKACRGQQRRRLMDLGIIPGTKIAAEMQSVGGDPTAYRVRGALVALRKLQAKHIFVEPEGEEA